ncbi:50S ribosomal protein L1 [Candidatus Margulisiibacteriota bacterium]
MGRGKKYKEQEKLVDKGNLYFPKEAITKVRELGFAAFDETVELHFNLGIDPRHADQQLRGTVALPHGTGKKIRIVVIAKGEALNELKDCGVDAIGAEDMIDKISQGWLDFDLVITSPDMMSKVARLGKILGVKGMMPTPKNGTVTTDIAKTVKEFKAGKIEYRNDKSGLIHLPIGKKSFDVKQLYENFMSIYKIILKAKPSKSKGVYIKSLTLCTTMSPAIHLEPMKNKWKEN